MNLEFNVVMIEVSLHAFAIHLEDVEVHDGKASVPPVIATCKLVIVDVEDVVYEMKVVFNLLVPCNMKAALSLSDSCVEVRHLGSEN